MKFKSLENKFFLKYNFLFWVYVAAVIIISLLGFFRGHYNNYLIFSKSFEILKNHGDPYIPHPEFYFDVFRYTPAFSVLIAPLAILPDLIGMLLWNLLNAMVLFWGVKKIFRENEKTGVFVLWIIFVELTTALGNCQANGIVAGLMLLAFQSFREKKTVRAAFFLVLNLFVKIYGFAAAALFLVEPRKWKYILASLAFFILFVLLPLLVVSPAELQQLYINEFTSIAAYSTNLSLMGILKVWFGMNFNDLLIQIPALAIVMLPVLFSITHTNEKLKILFFSSLMIFVISFNQMAESPTYIIGVTGFALWFVNGKKNGINIFLFVLTMIFTCFAPTDFFPKFIKHDFFVPYRIKAFPLCLVWLKVQFDIWEMIILNWRQRFIKQ